jgi:hypothetical protein
VAVEILLSRHRPGRNPWRGRQSSQAARLLGAAVAPDLGRTAFGVGYGAYPIGSSAIMRVPGLEAVRRRLLARLGGRSRAYCTSFDRHYLARGITMIRSLIRHDPGAAIHVLALDDVCESVLRELLGPAIHVIGTEALQARHPELRALRERRSAWAFYATQKPVLGLLTMQSDLRPQSVVFIDADTWFFSGTAPLFAEIGGASIGLSPHRFPPENQHLLIYGTYNAGFIFWRADQTGRRCLEDWKRECFACCDEQTHPDGRFMNQGYLTHWPERYPGVHIIGHPGANLAPWNVDSHVLTNNGGNLLVDGRELVFYHYSGLMQDPERRWCSIYPHAHHQLGLVRDMIYAPYLAAVEAERNRILQTCGIDGAGSVRGDLPIGPHMVRFDPQLK